MVSRTKVKQNKINKVIYQAINLSRGQLHNYLHFTDYKTEAKGIYWKIFKFTISNFFIMKIKHYFIINMR